MFFDSEVIIMAKLESDPVKLTVDYDGKQHTIYRSSGSIVGISGYKELIEDVLAYCSFGPNFARDATRPLSLEFTQQARKVLDRSQKESIEAIIESYNKIVKQTKERGY